jgi:hypothetical protein
VPRLSPAVERRAIAGDCDPTRAAAALGASAAARHGTVARAAAFALRVQVIRPEAALTQQKYMSRRAARSSLAFQG